MKKTLRGMILLLLSITLLLGQTLAANAVPRKILNCRDSVVRIFAAYDDGWYSGSGFVVKQEKNRTIIATNYHVVEGNPYEVEVYIGGDASAQAKVLASDKKRDLCLLEFRSPVRLAPMTLAAGRAEQGDAVYALGYPAAADAFSDTELHSGEEVTITDGIISAVRTATIENNGPAVKLLQISAAINGGNSGGPLFNEKGQVIGINTYGLDDTQGIFAAIEVGELLDFMKQNGILNNGMPIWVWLVVGAGAIIVGAFVLLLIKKKKSLDFVEDDTRREERRLARKAKLKKTAKVIGRTAAGLAAVVAIVVGAYFVTYRMAVSKAEKGNFTGAEKLLLVPAVTERHDEKLDDYISAGLLLESEDFVEAKKQFKGLLDYRGADEMVLECDYRYGLWLIDNDSLQDAQRVFTMLAEYKDSSAILEEIVDGIKEVQYQRAKELLNQKQWKNAMGSFSLIGDYKDSKKCLAMAEYNYAGVLFDEGKYELAASLFTRCKEYYPDAEEKYKKAKLEYAVQLWNAEEYISAISNFELIVDYAPAIQKILELKPEMYNVAVALYNGGLKENQELSVITGKISTYLIPSAALHAKVLFSLIHPYKDSGYYLEQLQ